MRDRVMAGDRASATAPRLASRRAVEPRAAETIAVLVAACAAYFLLSRYFLVAPETVVTLRNNVLFETDSGVRLRYLTDPGTWAATRLELLQHPAVFFVWRPIGLALTFLFRLVAAPVQAQVLAVQAMICTSAAVGTTVLYRMVGRYGVRAPLSLLPLGLLMFATATVLVIVPEHWAMAQGMMLSACYLLTLPGRPGRGRLVMLGLLCALIAATTITNALFALLLLLPLARAAGIRLPERRVVAGLAVAGFTALMAGVWLLTRLRQVTGFMNMRLVETPLRGLSYMLFGVIGPIIGPVPHESIERQHLVLSYEPVAFGMYTPIQWLSVVAWSCLLGVCTWYAVRDRESRPIAAFLLAWIGFNLLFHNLWGDEFFLYSGHWAWALIALVALGMRHLRARLLVPLVSAVVVGQVMTLLTIGAILRRSPDAPPRAATFGIDREVSPLLQYPQNPGRTSP
jgi:hypothetical protein